MTKDPFNFGVCFRLVPLRRYIREGHLPNIDDAALAVYVVIAAHADRNGYAFPGFTVIARFSGISKSTINTALACLERLGFLSVNRSSRAFKYQLFLGDWQQEPKNYIPIWQPLVRSGLWAKCPPAAKRLLLVLLALSLPGDGELESVDDKAFNENLSQSLKVTGARCVHVRDLDPRYLAELCTPPGRIHQSSMAGRTFRSAMEHLKENALVESIDLTGELRLPNMPSRWVPQVIEALERDRKADAKRVLTIGAKLSARSRRQRLWTGELQRYSSKSEWVPGHEPPPREGNTNVAEDLDLFGISQSDNWPF